MMQIQVRQFRYPRDYDAALRLWKSMDHGVRVGPSDTPGEIEKKLQRDPDLFLVADVGDRLVGTVIGGYDGRRGFVYHLAVEASFRQKGVGTKLMQEVERRLLAKGCVRCYLLVRPENIGAKRYYEKVGWSLLDDHVYGKDLV